MKTIPAVSAAQWLNYLVEISATLAVAEDIPAITHMQWRRVWEAKCKANFVIADLMSRVVADVEIEPAKEAV